MIESEDRLKVCARGKEESFDYLGKSLYKVIIKATGNLFLFPRHGIFIGNGCRQGYIDIQVKVKLTLENSLI